MILGNVGKRRALEACTYATLSVVVDISVLTHTLGTKTHVYIHICIYICIHM